MKIVCFYLKHVSNARCCRSLNTKCPCVCVCVVVLQRKDLSRVAALLPEVPEFQLSDGVHRQYLGRAQKRHTMDCAAVCIFCAKIWENIWQIIYSVCVYTIKSISIWTATHFS